MFTNCQSIILWQKMKLLSPKIAATIIQQASFVTSNVAKKSYESDETLLKRETEQEGTDVW